MSSNVLHQITKEQMTAREVYKEIEKEALQWRGNKKIKITFFGPCQDLTVRKPFARQEWWGRHAEKHGASGLFDSIDQIVDIEQPGVALDIGCGMSESSCYLLDKGWTVICLDYSKKALAVMEQRAAKINKNWLETGQLTLTCSDIADYTWPTQVNLIVASSSLPYFNPLKIKDIMPKAYKNLKVNGYFVGNFFSSEYLDESLVEAFREMGAWFVKGANSVRSLLKDQGYKVMKCERGSTKNPYSVVFVGKKC